MESYLCEAWNQETLVGRWSDTETLYVVRPEPYTYNYVSPPQLSDLVALVHGKLTELDHTIMSALIVMEVHAQTAPVLALLVQCEHKCYS